MRAEVARLTGLKAQGLAVLDGHERDAAESGFGPDHDGQIAAIRRFERTCSRRFEWARGQLKAGRHGYQPDGPAPRWIAPAPEASPPAPAPAPSPPVEERSRAQTRAERPAAPIVAPAAQAPSVEVPRAARPTDGLRGLLGIAVPPGNRHSRRSQAAAGRRNG